MKGITPGFESVALMLCKALAESGPVSPTDFDDEWTPLGAAYRDELVTGGLVDIIQDEENDDLLIVLTGAGVALANGEAPVAAEPAPQP